MTWGLRRKLSDSNALLVKAYSQGRYFQILPYLVE